MKEQDITITLSPNEKDAIEFMLDDQMNYWLHDSGCPEEYKGSIEAGILLYDKIGEKEISARYQDLADKVFGKEARTMEQEEAAKRELPPMRTEKEKTAILDEIYDKIAQNVADSMNAELGNGIILNKIFPTYRDEIEAEDVERILKSDYPRLTLEDTVHDYFECDTVGADWGDHILEAYDSKLTEEEQDFVQSYIDEFEPTRDEVSLFYDIYECVDAYQYEGSPVAQQMIPVDVIIDPTYAKDIKDKGLRETLETLPNKSFHAVALCSIPLEDCVQMLEARNREKDLGKDAKGTLTLPAGTRYDQHSFDVGSGYFDSTLEKPVEIPLQAVSFHDDRFPFYEKCRSWSVQETCGAGGENWTEDVELHAMSDKELQKAFDIHQKRKVPVR